MADVGDSLEGVPESGRARLELNKAGLFTSDLTVNEYLLIEDAGYRTARSRARNIHLPHRVPASALGA